MSEQGKYTSMINRAGALIDETKTLFAHWDDSLTPLQNLEHAAQDNLFAKPTRDWVRQFLAIFRRRYLSIEGLAPALAVLAKGQFQQEAFNLVLFYFSARNDLFMHDVVTEFCIPQWKKGECTIDVQKFTDLVSQWLEQGKMTEPWGAATRKRAISGVLTALRDFGMLQGNTIKKIVPPYLPPRAFSFIAFFLQSSAKGEKLLHHPAWRLFFLDLKEVERHFMEAHQEKLLDYQAAGSLVRIEFPSETPKEYAYALTER